MTWTFGFHTGLSRNLAFGIEYHWILRYKFGPLKFNEHNQNIKHVSKFWQMKCTRIHALKAPFLLEALGVLMTLPRCAISRCHPHHSAKRSQQSMSASEKLANMSPNDSRLGFEDCSPISIYWRIFIELLIYLHRIRKHRHFVSNW